MSELEFKLEDLPHKSLAACVVAYRTLGMNKELAKDCMRELARRRANGDDFDYEAFIDSEVKKVPIANTFSTDAAINAGKNILLGVLKK